MSPNAIKDKGGINLATLQERINQLQAEIADLKRRFPAHSLKPAMFQQLEDLEEELEKLLQQQNEEQLHPNS
ncbi:hypothetical protein [Neomoorella mulderi]|uniref:Uncharacterized protein n=1 Tax=Moorella mulderi DSM 14980 TaxID=1122241 RepID=A0A151AUJ1_9FIRM|nr:hypothetical protein [Moorella mulderi]KYH31233.1 hypothetical protein MOMUL_24640 [Moorella mulderi DSM 14980]